VPAFGYVDGSRVGIGNAVLVMKIATGSRNKCCASSIIANDSGQPSSESGPRRRAVWFESTRYKWRLHTLSRIIVGFLSRHCQARMRQDPVGSFFFRSELSHVTDHAVRPHNLHAPNFAFTYRE
jgi:hypothetical protein